MTSPSHTVRLFRITTICHSAKKHKYSKKPLGRFNCVRGKFGTCLFGTTVASNVLMLQGYFLSVLILLIVRKPLRGFSFTSRSAGKSVGSPFAFFSTLAKK